jgi:hypothetical protein
LGFDPQSSGAPDAFFFFAQTRFNDLSAADQAFYVRYVAVCLAPFANVAGWNYTWETDGTTDKQYSAMLLTQYDLWDHW